jgi:hypothetical protein
MRNPFIGTVIKTNHMGIGTEVATTVLIRTHNSVPLYVRMTRKTMTSNPRNILMCGRISPFRIFWSSDPIVMWLRRLSPIVPPMKVNHTRMNLATSSDQIREVLNIYRNTTWLKANANRANRLRVIKNSTALSILLNSLFTYASLIPYVSVPNGLFISILRFNGRKKMAPRDMA